MGVLLAPPLGKPSKEKNYETYNNERKEQVFASSSKFQINNSHLVSYK